MFLDEPTTGLDPRSRLSLWELIRELRSEGTTHLLTTQYLEEADNLADRIAVIDLGTVIAEGTSDELKDEIGGEVLELHVADKAETEKAAVAARRASAPASTRSTARPGSSGSTPVTTAPAWSSRAVRRLDESKIWVADLALHKPTLDDVFLQLTGRTAEEVEEEDFVEPQKKQRPRTQEAAGAGARAAGGRLVSAVALTRPPAGSRMRARASPTV